jgi:hypothetical protein
MHLNFGVRYTFGGEATYLKEGGLRVENNQVVMDKLRSRTNMISLRAGLTMEFFIVPD